MGNNDTSDDVTGTATHEWIDRLAELLECDSEVGCICAAAIHRNRERDQMRKTIGELRGRVERTSDEGLMQAAIVRQNQLIHLARQWCIDVSRGFDVLASASLDEIDQIVAELRD